MALETLDSQVERIVVIKQDNEYGPANPELIEKRIDYWGDERIRDGRPYVVLPSKPTLEATEKLLLDNQVDSRTLIEVLGGDGTFHMVIDAQEALGLDNPDSHPGGGGAICIARDLIESKEHREKPHEIFSNLAVPHRQLLIDADHTSLAKNDPRRRFRAVGFFTIGFTGIMADRFNQPDFREHLQGKKPNHRLLEQGLEIARHLPYDNQFTLEDNTGVRDLNELVLTNNHIVAAAFKFKGTRLLKDGYGRMEVDGLVTIPGLIKAYSKARMGRYDRLQPYTIQEFAVTTPDEAPFVAEVDGEALNFPSGTEFRVQQVTSRIRLVTSAKQKHIDSAEAA